MILVADSGSTKTTWAVVGVGNKIVTEGLNPHFSSDEAFFEACAAVRQHVSLLEEPFRVYFYGAGCGDLHQCSRVQTLLSAAFCTGDIHVSTDMLGACRALCGVHAGLVGILGTGSNVCYYDGEDIAYQPASTGYILGDNGSANHVGRILLNDYLTHRMPESIINRMQFRLQMTDAQLMDAVYHQPHPNRFLASLAPIAVECHRENDYCAQVILQALHDWYYGPVTMVMEHIEDQGIELNLVGGFAKAIEDTLRHYLADRGFTVGTVMSEPIDGLLDYHGFSGAPVQ